VIAKLADNRVYRSYLGGSRIDAFVGGKRTEDGHFPEDWLASTVRAFNPGREALVEGYGHTEAGIPVTQLVPEGLPILVKLLDAAERLVIQAHPTRAFARQYFGSPVGKTESWYILEADETACVYIGFQKSVTRAAWAHCFARQDVAGMLDLLHRFPVRPGECVFVPGGVPHAIGGGCLMIETQEPSDLMVVPERVTPSGVPLSDQKCHGGLGFERMLDCFEYDGLTRAEARARFFPVPRALDAHACLLLDGAENGAFTVLAIDTGTSYSPAFSLDMAVAVVTEGEGSLALGEEAPLRVCRGDRLLLTGLRRQPLSMDAGSGRLRIVLAMGLA